MKLAENKRFILRTIQKGDELDIAKYINDKTISKNTATIPYPYKLKDAKAWMGKYFKEQKKKEPESISFALVINGEVVGSVGFHDIKKNHKAEIGYWLARKHWGKGIVSEAVKLVTNYGFKKLKLKRIYAGVYAFNPPSMKVLEKNDFQCEGVMRKFVKKSGKYFDAHLFARIK